MTSPAIDVNMSDNPRSLRHKGIPLDIIHKLLHSVRFAYAVGGVLVFVASAVAFVFVGWLGIALIGIMGLYVSTRLDLHDGNAVADFDYGSSAVHMLARQIEQQRNASHQDREQQDIERKQRKHLIYLMNTLWLAMIGLGFVMFATHQV